MKTDSTLDFKAIGERLSLILDQNSISKAELAKQIGVSKSTATAWVNGQSLTVNSVKLICETLKISTNWLVIGIGPTSPPVDMELSQKEKTLIFSTRAVSNDFFKTLQKILIGFEKKDKDLRIGIPHLCGIRFLSESNTGAVIMDSSGVILECNEAFRNITGITLSKNKSENPTIFKLIPLEYSAKVKQELERVHLTTGPFGEYILVNRLNSLKTKVITKASMVEYKNKLAIGVIVKPTYG